MYKTKLTTKERLRLISFLQIIISVFCFATLNSNKKIYFLIFFLSFSILIFGISFFKPVSKKDFFKGKSQVILSNFFGMCFLLIGILELLCHKDLFSILLAFDIGLILLIL